MPSTSPGDAPGSPTTFAQILPGAPTPSLQACSSFVFRHRRFVVYISGSQLNLLSSPSKLVQAVTFPAELVAVAAEAGTGKIVVASRSDVWVMEPATEGWTKMWWEKALSLRREDPGDEMQSLSWGNEGEVLLGGSRHLSLFSTLPSSRNSSPATSSATGEAIEERRMLWSKSVASPVQIVAFSPSASLISTCGACDRMVKIWRRLSFEEGLFDYTYLPHAGVVTYLQWRPLDETSDGRRNSSTSRRHNDDPEVLYTVANDGQLRVWRSGGIHDLDMLSLHATVDLVSAIPQSPSLTVKGKGQPKGKSTRYIFTLPSDKFCAAVTSVIGLESKEKLSHSLEHLKEIMSHEPDVVVTVDDYGRMSAWGLQNIGHKRRPEAPESTSPFHIAHAEGLPLGLGRGVNARFDAWFEDGTFHLLSHAFDDGVRWWTGGVEEFFSPSVPGAERIKERGHWQGQHAPVAGLSISHDDCAIISWNENHEVACWQADEQSTFRKGCSFVPSNIVSAAFLIGTANHTVILESGPQNLVLRDLDGQELTKTTYALNGACQLFVSQYSKPQCHLVALSSFGKGCVFTLKPDQAIFGEHNEFSLPPLESGEPFWLVKAVLDSTYSSRFGVVAITESGSLLLYHIRQAEGGTCLEPFQMANFVTDAKRASILAVNNDIAAIASSNGETLSVINLRDGYLEHKQIFGGEQIQHIEVSSRHNLVAVSHAMTIDVFAQGRYGLSDDLQTWTLIKNISFSGLGLSINSTAWMGNGSLAVAAGNGIVLIKNDLPVDAINEEVKKAIELEPNDKTQIEVLNLCDRLKAPLPVWHPNFVSYMVQNDRWRLVIGLLRRLHEKLKFWSEDDGLDALLSIPAEQLYGAESMHKEAVLDQDTVTSLQQLLEEKTLPALSQHEQHQLKSILEAIAFCAEHVSGLDNYALRYLFNWKVQLIHISIKTKSSSQPPEPHSDLERTVPKMHRREIAFAYHSTSQQRLLDILVAQYDNKLDWFIVDRLGLTAWLNSEALRQIFEALAQSAYRATNPPDPINASLYFLALHKRTTLLGLWRIATWHKEQRSTINFLKRDFEQPENKTAAKKNAYALMGKRRFDYAAAFFLLADDAASATSVLAGQCGNVMLAVAVARLHSGDGSPILRKLIDDRFLPDAKKSGDRWLVSWCHSILSNKYQAADTLVCPIEEVPRIWRQDEPCTLALYRLLRKEESNYEWEAVLRAARVLRRMGLWLLAIDLLRTWEFRSPPSTPLLDKAAWPNDVNQREPSSMLESFTDNPASVFTSTSEPTQPPSMLDGFAVPALDNMASREAKAAELLAKIKLKKGDVAPIHEKSVRQSTQFKEPDAESLLDSFGF